MSIDHVNPATAHGLACLKLLYGDRLAGTHESDLSLIPLNPLPPATHNSTQKANRSRELLRCSREDPRIVALPAGEGCGECLRHKWTCFVAITIDMRTRPNARSGAPSSTDLAPRGRGNKRPRSSLSPMSAPPPKEMTWELCDFLRPPRSRCLTCSKNSSKCDLSTTYPSTSTCSPLHVTADRAGPDLPSFAPPADSEAPNGPFCKRPSSSISPAMPGGATVSSLPIDRPTIPPVTIPLPFPHPFGFSERENLTNDTAEPIPCGQPFPFANAQPIPSDHHPRSELPTRLHGQKWLFDSQDWLNRNIEVGLACPEFLYPNRGDRADDSKTEITVDTTGDKDKGSYPRGLQCSELKVAGSAEVIRSGASRGSGSDIVAPIDRQTSDIDRTGEKDETMLVEEGVPFPPISGHRRAAIEAWTKSLASSDGKDSGQKRR